MEFDWMTVILEVLNFLVLVWLLKRFFYRPVLAVILKRQAASEKIMTDAQSRRAEAEALKSEYTLRLADADKERELAMARLEEEIAAERQQRLSAVAAEVAADRQRRLMLNTREDAEKAAALERQAVAIAARFASRFLERLAGPPLDAQLVDLALADLAAPEKRAALSTALAESGAGIKVLTAYPLDAPRRAALNALLGSLAGRPLEAEFGLQPELKSGLCLRVGSWVFMANLRDELDFFSGTPGHGG